MPHAVLGRDPAAGTTPFLIVRIATAVMSWSMIVLLLALAERIADGRSPCARC